MQNLNESVKSRGVLLFAFNSKVTDYVKIADVASRLIEKFLKLPVTVVTDVDALPEFNYENVIRAEAKTGNVRPDRKHRMVEWKNYDRCRAYELSPYDETILIDTDYLILDDSLLKLFEQPFDYRLQYRMQTPLGLNTDEMGPVSLPMIWATVVLFRKTASSKIFFDLVSKIQRNYDYYRVLFGIRDTNYRNDFAFSIASMVLNGYIICPEKSIPWPLLTIEDPIVELELNNNFVVSRHDDVAHVIAQQNLHIMDKGFLTSKKFEQFVERVCNG